MIISWCIIYNRDKQRDNVLFDWLINIANQIVPSLNISYINHCVGVCRRKLPTTTPSVAWKKPIYWNWRCCTCARWRSRNRQRCAPTEASRSRVRPLRQPASIFNPTGPATRPVVSIWNISSNRTKSTRSPKSDYSVTCSWESPTRKLRTANPIRPLMSTSVRPD